MGIKGHKTELVNKTIFIIKLTFVTFLNLIFVKKEYAFTFCYTSFVF